MKSIVNKITSRTAKFENKKQELAKESGRKVCFVEKSIFNLNFEENSTLELANWSIRYIGYKNKLYLTILAPK